MNVAVVNGSLSESSSGAALARRIIEQVKDSRPEDSSEPTFEWVDLRSLGHGLVDALYTGVEPPPVRKAYRAVQDADLIIAISPTYQASMSGLFKLFWDLLPDDGVRGKPVLLAATGGTGRHGLMIDHSMRPLFAYLGAVPLPTALFAATQDWGDAGMEVEVGYEEPLEKRIERASREIWNYLSSGIPSPFQPAREEKRSAPEGSPSVTETFPGFVDFETLLEGRGR